MLKKKTKEKGRKKKKKKRHKTYGFRKRQKLKGKKSPKKKITNPCARYTWVFSFFLDIVFFLQFCLYFGEKTFWWA